MPFNQPATNNYFGFQPVMAAGGVAQITPYLVSSSEASQISIGDVVTMTSIGTVRITTGTYIPTSSMPTVGVAASVVTANGGSTAALINAPSSQVALVYDGPGQLFMGCDTTSGAVGTQTGLFKNYAIISTGCVGSTGPSSAGRSAMVIGGVTATAAGAFHLVALHPMEQGLFSSVAAAATVTSSGVRKWIGFFNSGITVNSTSLSAMINTTS